MSPSSLYSLRMHASCDGNHLSGAERLACLEDLEGAAAALIRRALTHPRGRAEEIRLSLDLLAPEEVRSGRLPDVTTVKVDDYRQGRAAARDVLLAQGVAPCAVEAAFSSLIEGAAPGAKSMRGAMLVDTDSGERLEPDRSRGVRATRMDLSVQARSALEGELAHRGLDNDHVREALVLAAKVAAAPGVVAELCWSDDPDYTAGYVCTPHLGYLRFPHLKPPGEDRGGRAFFVRPREVPLEEITHFLERVPVLFETVGRFHPDRLWRDADASHPPLFSPA